MADLDVRDLVVEYTSGGYVVRALDHVNVHATDGELVLLLGPSGSGKTTLLSCLAGILRPTSGTISLGQATVSALDGRALTDYRRHSVGIVFQAFNLVPSLTALENVDAPLRAGGIRSRQARARATELIELVGLADRATHRPGHLSGGQQQRVAIARALAFDPPLLLADEPTAHLDYTQVDVVLRILRELAAPGRLVVVSTHDDRIAPLADRVVELARVPEEARPRKKVKLARGDVLFEEGSRGGLIYVVESGEIEVVRRRPDGTEETLSTYGPKEYFGELGPLLGFPRAATARARRASVVTGYTVAEFREAVGADHVSNLLGRAARRRAKPRPKATRRHARSRSK